MLSINLSARSDRSRWVVLAIAVASTAIGVMIFASAFPLLPLWVRDLGISHAKTGAARQQGLDPQRHDTSADAKVR